MSDRPTILYLVTEDWYFCSHRLPLAKAARDAGYRVVVATRVGRFAEAIQAEGLELMPLHWNRANKNPLRELVSLAEVCRVYAKVRPDIVHHVALKPVLYGSVAAMAGRIRVRVNAIAGLGFVFSSRSLTSRISRPLFLVALKLLLNLGKGKVILQNPDDQRFLVDNHIVNPDRTVLIRGSGVDISVFRPTPEPGGTPLVILASRMIWDKGIGEFVEAARSLKQWGIVARFALVGDTDEGNFSAVPGETLNQWRDEGTVEWWGKVQDMPGVFAKSHVVCLPTAYGEGVPKVLIEAAACGRPIVTTDAPGCREIVRDGQNGLLIPAGNVAALENALSRLIADPELRRQMGDQGRSIVESEFALEKVVTETLAVYDALLR